MACIRSFYKNADIFVTGGTGFVGKVLIEKLLRSCPEISTINVLIRPTQKQSSQERLLELRRNPVFTRIHKECPDALGKLRVVSGDITVPNLGLERTEMDHLSKNVNVVFNVAASVYFNNPLTEAANLNTISAKRVIKICNEFENLKSFVHVSTAYSNLPTKTIDEKVYSTSDKISKDSFLTLVENLPKPLLNSVRDEIVAPYPNTYTFTKGMAEQVVSEFANKFPVCIIRPSIITASISDPMPGWIDSKDGMGGVVLANSHGLIKAFPTRKNAVVDLIPVDLICNSAIAAAWDTNRNYNKESPIPVYNCTSKGFNPITWKTLHYLINKTCREIPFEKSVSVPMSFSVSEPRMYEIIKFLVFDIPNKFKIGVATVMGHGLVARKRVKSLENYIKTNTYFCRTEYDFKNDRMRDLITKVQIDPNGNEFNCDVSKIDWESYFKDYVLGIRRHVLGQSDDTLEMTRKRLKRNFWKNVLSITMGSATGTLILFYFSN